MKYLTPQMSWAYCDIHGDIIVRIKERKERRLFCVQLWISEGRPGLDPQVWEDTNSAVFTMPT